MIYDLDTLEQLAGIFANIVGSLGVIVSLIYVVREIRLNTTAQRNAAYQTIINTMADIESRISSDSDLARIYRIGREGQTVLTEDEAVRFNELLSSFFNLYEAMYYQHRDDIILKELWLGWCENMRADLAHPGVEQWWQGRQNLYGQKFRDVVNKGRC